LTAAAALLDSNVAIAILAEAHEHHAVSLALITEGDPAAFAISAHSYAETYATLTRRGDRAPFHFRADEAWAALESLRAVAGLATHARIVLECRCLDAASVPDSDAARRGFALTAATLGYTCIPTYI
jgi:predicted nucleic acid-binding protein